MKAKKIMAADISWEPAVEVFGERAFFNGQPLVENKVLSDRRADGAGVAYLLKFKPPQGKLIKIVATARSDEHVYLLEGGYCNRRGEPIAASGAYGINAPGNLTAPLLRPKPRRWWFIVARRTKFTNLRWSIRCDGAVVKCAKYTLAKTYPPRSRIQLHATLTLR
jgi:hypothetical protein